MRNVKTGWREYSALLPESAGDVQLRETEQAFYAGALHIMGVLVENSELPEDDAMARLDGLMTETRGRFRELLDARLAATRE
jgi:hypothetical protein